MAKLSRDSMIENDYDFERQMHLARKVMLERHEMLRQLATPDLALDTNAKPVAKGATRPLPASRAHDEK